jgi:hypothetical protein
VNIALAMTLHDPEGRLFDQLRRTLPILQSCFNFLAVRATNRTQQPILDFLAAAGIAIDLEGSSEAAGDWELGKARRAAVTLAFQQPVPAAIYCDLDRALHWAENFPAELAEIALRIAAHDFTVLGRTGRAFETHPRVQRDTEAIINHVFAEVSGNPWDVTGAARGLSRRAAEAIITGCDDNSVSADVSWPLFIQRSGDFSIDYIETEGLEFETADRFADEIASAGGREKWIARIDSDPRQWALRLELARIEVAGLQPYISAY